jgi:hypothetical protein
MATSSAEVLARSVLARSDAGRLRMDLPVELCADEELRRLVLARCKRSDLYLIALDSSRGFVIRHDLRSEAIRRFVEQGGLDHSLYRWIVIKAHLQHLASRGRLTKRGEQRRRQADKRIQHLADELLSPTTTAADS